MTLRGQVEKQNSRRPTHTSRGGRKNLEAWNTSEINDVSGEMLRGAQCFKISSIMTLTNKGHGDLVRLWARVQWVEPVVLWKGH